MFHDLQSWALFNRWGGRNTSSHDQFSLPCELVPQPQQLLQILLDWKYSFTDYCTLVLSAKKKIWSMVTHGETQFSLCCNQENYGLDLDGWLVVLFRDQPCPHRSHSHHREAHFCSIRTTWDERKAQSIASKLLLIKSSELRVLINLAWIIGSSKFGK